MQTRKTSQDDCIVNVADLRRPERNVIEVLAVCLVRGSLFEDVFAKTTSEDRCTHVILSPKNGNCLAMNEEVMKTLAGETVTYVSPDSVKCDNIEEAQNYPMEFINCLTPSGMPNHHLNLKIAVSSHCITTLPCNRGCAMV